MSEFTFEGFEPANTIPVPDVLFDKLLPYLNEAQLKVVLYIIRRTLGFKKTADAISLKQFRWGITTKDGKKLDEGCGLKNFTTIIKALRELEQMNCIVSDKRESGIGDQDTTIYRIRFRGTTQNVVPTTQSTVPSLSGVVGVLREAEDGTTPTVEGVLRQSYPQETVLQETVLQEESTPVSLPRFSLITYADCIAYLKLRNVHPQGDAVEIMVQARTLYVADRAEQYPPSQKKAYVAPVLSQQSEEEHQRVLALFGRPCDTCGRSITTPDCPWCATVRVPAVVPPRQSTPPLSGRVAAVAASSLPTPLSDAPPVPATAPPDRPEVAPAQPQLVALPPKRPRKKAEPLPAMSEEATRVWQRWRSLFTRETPLTRRDMEAAEQLAASAPTAEELGACRKWLFTTDNPERPWYRRIGVGLPDVAKNWSKWQSLQDAPPLDLQLVKKAEGPRLPPPMPSDEELRKQVY